MPISFTCPHCGATTMAADELAGASGACASCGQMIVIPAGGVVAEEGPRGTRWLLWGAGALVLIVVGGVGAATYYAPRWMAMMKAAEERRSCHDNLNRIALALEGYHTKFKTYPPPVVFDKQGRPMHSWRVLILPYLDTDAEKLYEEYKLDEPWDGPNNQKLSLRMPAVYGCPCDPGSFRSQTSYLAIADPATGNMGAITPGWLKLQPGTKTQMLVAEIVGSNVLWMQPQDVIPGPAAGTTLSANLVNLPACDPAKLSHLSYHIDGGHLLLDDGTIEFRADGEMRVCLQ